MDVFTYEDTETFDSNFRKWYYMNSKERSMYGETLQTEQEGYVMFCGLYSQHAPSRSWKNLRSFLT